MPSENQPTTAHPADPEAVCYSCGEHLDREDTVEVPTIGGPSTSCVDCADTEWFTCGECGELKSNDEDNHETENGEVCSGCFETNYWVCPECSDTYHTDSGEDRVAPNGNIYCEGCFGDTCGYCDSCDEAVWTESMCYDDDRDCYVCEHCHRSNRGPIHDYSFKPSAEFHGEVKTLGRFPRRIKLEPHLAFELEVQNTNSRTSDRTAAQEVTSGGEGLLYCKVDCSISGDSGCSGFEVVSHPATLDWFKANTSKLAAVFALRGEGFTSYDSRTCGLHIHMCQAAFRDLHLYKFLSFIYNHPNFSKGISQRTNTQLNEWCVLDAGGPLADCAKKKRTHTRGAVNLETHSRTIELRLFRGTLFEPSFWAKLEFSHALWRFTRDVSVPKANPTVFVETLDNWKKDYPHLHQFIADRPELRDYNQPPTNQPTRRNSNPYTHSERTV